MTIDDHSIDVAIDDIALTPQGPKATPAKPTGKPAPRQPTIAELEAARRERDQHARQAADAQAQVLAAQTRADAEAKARGEAEGALLQTRGHALQERYSRVAGELSQIESAIASTQALAGSAERDLQAAHADETASVQDKATRIAKAQRELSRAEAELVQLESGKGGAERAVADARWYIEEEGRANAALADARAKAPPADTDPARTAAPAGKQTQQQTPDQWIDGIRQNVGGKVADWLAEHKEFVTDDKLNRKVIAYAQQCAVVDEMQLNSDDFVAALNAKFLPDQDPDAGNAGGNEDVEDVVEETPPAARSTPKVTPAAPVSRNGGYFSSRNPAGAKIKLSPALANLAREMGLTPEEYALNARAEIIKGKLPKNFLDPDYQPAV